MSRARRKRKREAAQPSPPAAPPTPWPWTPVALAAVAFLLRVFRMMDGLPVVGDESIYLRWAEIIENQGQWMISTLDGKAPLSYWLYTLTRYVWDDPLFGPRLISAVAGAATTALVYGIGRRLGSPQAGLVAGALYAVLPWAMLYDRLAYTEGLVNLGAAATAYTALWAFARGQSLRGLSPDSSAEKDRGQSTQGLSPTWTAAAVAGLVLGLSLFTKSTALLYAPAPLLAALLLGRPRAQAPQLALTYAVAAVFPALTAAFTPQAPQAEDHSVLFHKTHFFLGPAELAENPLGGLTQNLPELLQFLGAYVTWPALAVIAAAFVVLLRSEPRKALFLLGLSVAPIAAEAVLLNRFYSRYPYPHVWPLLVAAALAYATLAAREKTRLAARLGLAVLGGIFLVQSLRLLVTPAAAMARLDSAYYFSDAPNAGWGLTRIVAQIRREARQAGPTLVLVDPIWGTPADAVFAYLNGRDGVRVVEAWWIENQPPAPLLPSREIEIWKSHYERTSGGRIDFQDYERIYYVTLTNYRTPEQVAALAPRARRETSVPKPGGVHSLDLYRLR